jgi:hypothetical protein
LAADGGGEIEKLAGLVLGDVAESGDEFQVRFDLGQGRTGDRDEVRVFGEAMTGVALGDVGANGNGGSLELTGEPVCLVLRKPATQLVDTDDQVHRQVPDPQISEPPHAHRPPLIT